jgi:hypothetical protein
MKAMQFKCGKVGYLMDLNRCGLFSSDGDAQKGNFSSPSEFRHMNDTQKAFVMGSKNFALQSMTNGRHGGKRFIYLILFSKKYQDAGAFCPSNTFTS